MFIMWLDTLSLKSYSGFFNTNINYFQVEFIQLLSCLVHWKKKKWGLREFNQDIHERIWSLSVTNTDKRNFILVNFIFKSPYDRLVKRGKTIHLNWEMNEFLEQYLVKEQYLIPA